MVSHDEAATSKFKHLTKQDLHKQIIIFDAAMREAAERLEFEKAIQFRDQIEELRKTLIRKDRLADISKTLE